MNQENTSNNPTWTQDWDKEMDSDTNTSLAAHVSSFEEQAVTLPIVVKSDAVNQITDVNTKSDKITIATDNYENQDNISINPEEKMNSENRTSVADQVSLFEEQKCTVPIVVEPDADINADIDNTSITTDNLKTNDENSKFSKKSRPELEGSVSTKHSVSMKSTAPVTRRSKPSLSPVRQKTEKFDYNNLKAMSAKIVVIGNPGAGKSTILNGLAGEVLFESGVSIGDGMTYQLDERENARGTFFDTPGLADNTLREAAGKAISTALRKGGNFKILFFVMTEAGRVVRQDVTTLKLVLDAVPEIRNQYGIVINKLPKNVLKQLMLPGKAGMFLTKLFAGIPDDRRCAQSNITYLSHNSDLDAEDNMLIDLDEMTSHNGESFTDFVYGQVPTVNLTVDKAGDIKTSEFDQMNDVLEELEQKMNKDREMFLEQQELLRVQLEKAETEKVEQQKKDKEYHEQQMKMLQESISHKEKEIEATKNDAERRFKHQEEMMKLQMEQQKHEFQAQMSTMAAQRRPGPPPPPCIVM